MEKHRGMLDIPTPPSNEDGESLEQKRRLLEGLLQVKYAQSLLVAEKETAKSDLEMDQKIIKYLKDVGDVFRHWFETMNDEDALAVQKYLDEHTLEEIQSMQGMDEILEVFKKSNVH